MLMPKTGNYTTMKGFGSCSKIGVPILDELNTKSIVKPGEEDPYDSSPFTDLPDDIILQILNKVIDLKTLCSCYVVSKRFSSVVLQVDAVSFTASLFKSPDKNLIRHVDSDESSRNLVRRLINGFGFKQSKPLAPIISSFYSQSFRSAITFLSKFKGVKSFCIQFPNSGDKDIDNNLGRWLIRRCGTSFESFIFFWPNSMSEIHEFHVNGNGDEKDMDDMFRPKLQSAVECIMARRIYWIIAKDMPKLEEVSLTKLGSSWKISFRGEELAKTKKKWATSGIHSVGIPSRLKHCYIPVLNLPVTGYVMKGMTLIVMEMNGFRDRIKIDDLIASGYDGYENKEQAAFAEAAIEIFGNHNSKMKVLPMYGH